MCGESLSRHYAYIRLFTDFTRPVTSAFMTSISSAFCDAFLYSKHPHSTVEINCVYSLSLPHKASRANAAIPNNPIASAEKNRTGSYITIDSPIGI